jgi:D-aminopeptidase
VIAFSTAHSVRITAGKRTTEEVANDDMSPLFLAVIEATEEAIYNSLFKATSVSGYGGHSIEALPIEKTVEILRRHGMVNNDAK